MRDRGVPRVRTGATGVAANRREAYYATIASRSSFHTRLGMPDLTGPAGMAVRTA